MESTLLQLLSGIDGWQASAIALKALTYGASFVSGGGVFFLVTFLSHLDELEKHKIGHVLGIAAAAGMIFSVLRIAVMSGMMSDGWSGLFSTEMMGMVLASSEGPALALRLTGLGLIALYFSARVTVRFLFIPLLGAILAIVSFGLTGHASELSNEIGVMPRALICLHLLSAAFWLGALWPLYRVTYGHDLDQIAAAMQRFGRMAVVAVGVLISVGLLLLWCLLGTPAALWQSAYGQLMMGKLLCVALLLWLAAVNKLRYTPRLLKGELGAVTSLRHSIAGEMGVACLILSITASLTMIAGPPALN